MMIRIEALFEPVTVIAPILLYEPYTCIKNLACFVIVTVCPLNILDFPWF